jgi:succinate-semialdehyde dehydrogenase/glutarate-semialdehyde dehydrogenase
VAYQTINPATGTLLQSFEHLSAAALEQCLTAAATCFGHWRHTAFAERAAVLNRAAVLLSWPRWPRWRWASAAPRPRPR